MATYPLQSTLAKTMSLTGGGMRYLRAVRTVTRIGRMYAQNQRKSRKYKEEIRQRNLQRTHREVGKMIRELCEENGATWVKMAQFFSCRPDLLPQEYIEELQVLQNEAPEVDFRDLVPVLEKELGTNWHKHFKFFDEQPVATASIAQVHRATLRNGDRVAVKIQQPQVKELFWQDVSKFKLIANMISPMVKEIDVSQVVEQMLKMTMDELDFNIEAKNLEVFKALEHNPRIKIPDYYPELSGEKILVTEWMVGVRLRDYLDEHRDEAQDLLTLLMHSYIQQVTEFGAYHGDPHPGNFLVNDKKEIIIIDFGVLARLTDDEIKNYTLLLLGLMTGQGENLGQLFEAAGFTGGSEETLKALGEYVVSDKMNSMELSEIMADLLEKFREQRISIPDSYVAMARVLITVGGFMLQYGVPFELPTAFIAQNMQKLISRGQEQEAAGQGS